MTAAAKARFPYHPESGRAALSLRQADAAGPEPAGATLTDSRRRRDRLSAQSAAAIMFPCGASRPCGPPGRLPGARQRAELVLPVFDDLSKAQWLRFLTVVPEATPEA